jgi:hypothetical protein
MTQVLDCNGDVRCKFAIGEPSTTDLLNLIETSQSYSKCRKY